MNKTILRNFAFFLCLCLGFSACTDDKKQKEDSYCIMFYGSGGDYQHDISLFSPIRDAAGQIDNPDQIALTALFVYSGADNTPEHSGVRRYTATNNSLKEDSSFVPDKNFKITDPAQLTDFIRWSVEKYPHRKYILVFGGHGCYWTLETDVAKGTLYDGQRVMTSEELAQGINGAETPIEALIAHSCQQGSIESIAEWEGTAKYLIGSPYSIPDLAYDYTVLIRELQKGKPIEDALKTTVTRSMNIWQHYDFEKETTVITLTRIDGLSPLWNALNETFAYMTSSMDGISVNTDAPAVTGEPFYKGYYRAMRKLAETDDEDKFERVIDLQNFLQTAIIESGNLELIKYVNRVDEELEKILILKAQKDEESEGTYNILWLDYYFNNPDNLKLYQSSRFDQQTHWSDFRAKLQQKISAK